MAARKIATPKAEPKVFTVGAIARVLNGADSGSVVNIIVGKKDYRIDVIALTVDGKIVLGVSPNQLRGKSND